MGKPKSKNTCKKLIAEKLKGRLGEFRSALQSEKETLSYQRENIVAVTKKFIYRIHLSWGGPEDFFEIEVDPVNGKVESLMYHYLDWMDGAKLPITLDEEFNTVIDMLRKYIEEGKK